MKLTNELKQVIDRARIRLANDGTSEGAKKGWETRRAGGFVAKGDESAATKAFESGQDAGIINAYQAYTGNTDDELSREWHRLQEQGLKYGWEDSDDEKFLDLSERMIRALPESLKGRAMKQLHDLYDVDDKHRAVFKKYFA